MVQTPGDHLHEVASPDDLPGRLVKGTFLRMYNQRYFLKVSLTIVKFVTVREIEGVTGKAAIPVLNTFVEMVETIIGEIETESRRLGIVK